MSGGELRSLLTKSFLERAGGGDAAKPTGPDRGSDIAAATADKTAAPVEDKSSTATREQKPQQAETPEEAPDVPFNLTHLTDPKVKAAVEAELAKYKESNQKNIQERINKEVAKRKALEGERDLLRQQIPVRSPLDAAQAQAQQRQAPAPVVPIPRPAPLSDLNDVNALNAKALEAKSIRDAADDALTIGPTSARIESDGRRVDIYELDGAQFTKEQLVTIRRNARETIESQIPARMNDLKAREFARQQADATFPWLRNPSAPEFQRAAAVANAFPWLKTLPNAENLIGTLVEGLNAIDARKSSSTNVSDRQAGSRRGANPPNDQAAFGGVGGAVSRAPDGTFRRAALDAEMAKLNGKKGVSGRDVRKYLLATDKLRNSR
jgi:hypothetical protein